MQFVKEFTAFKDLKTLNRLLKQNKTRFEESTLYNTKTKSTEIDHKTRESLTRYLYDKKLYQLADELIKQNFPECPGMQTLRTNVTHIIYQNGGFFKKHKDFFVPQADKIHYTLIICVAGVCSGGETIVHINEQTHIKSKNTVTPGKCLLFRKDMFHEGDVVKGTKEIIMFDVVEQLRDQTVVVGFEDDDRTYSIPVDFIRKNPAKNELQRFVSEKCGTKKLVTYHSQHSYEEFEIMYKVYTNKLRSLSDLTEDQVQILNQYDIANRYILCGAYNEKIQIDMDKIVRNKTGNIVLFKDNASYGQFMMDSFQNSKQYVPFTLYIGTSFRQDEYDRESYSYNSDPEDESGVYRQKKYYERSYPDISVPKVLKGSIDIDRVILGDDAIFDDHDTEKRGTSHIVHKFDANHEEKSFSSESFEMHYVAAKGLDVTSAPSFHLSHDGKITFTEQNACEMQSLLHKMNFIKEIIGLCRGKITFTEKMLYDGYESYQQCNCDAESEITEMYSLKIKGAVLCESNE